MMNKVKGVLIMPDTMDEVIKAKHWLISRNKDYKVVYLPIDISKKQSVIMTEFDLVDRILFRLTFSRRLEKVNVYL